MRYVPHVLELDGPGVIGESTSLNMLGLNICITFSVLSDLPAMVLSDLPAMVLSDLTVAFDYVLERTNLFEA